MYTDEKGNLHFDKGHTTPGHCFLNGQTSEAKLENVMRQLNGIHIVSGPVTDYKLIKENGFDVGKLTVEDFHLTFWNEYMTLSKEGNILSKFPDLIMTFDVDKMIPVPSANIKEGMLVAVIQVDPRNLNLSTTMKNEALLQEVEDIIGTIL
nr:DUF917 family protein [Lysinibacillus sp. FJAT-14745]